jgi:MFS family permease
MNSNSESRPIAPESTTPLWRDPNFLVLWCVGGMNSTGRWLEMLVIAIFVYDMTSSPLWVSSMLMLRLLPLSIFGIFGGVVAERFKRWSILKCASGTVLLLSLSLWWLASSGSLEIWHVGAASFISGLVWSTDFPVRRTLMGDIAGPSRVARAMSLDILAGSSTRVIGPLAGGLLYQYIGMQGAFLLTACLYLIGLTALFVRRKLPAEATHTPEPVLATIKSGFTHLRESPVLPPILAITIVFNLWGFPFVSLIPVFGKEVLTLSDAAVGMLASAEGVGALIGAIALSVFAQSRHARYLYVGGVLAYSIFSFAFAQSYTVWLSAALLLLVGLVSAAFGSMQSALILMNSPPGRERQMMGLLAVCIGSAPLGFLHIGLLADWLGTPTATAISAVEGAIALGLVVWRWPGVLSVQPNS